MSVVSFRPPRRRRLASVRPSLWAVLLAAAALTSGGPACLAASPSVEDELKFNEALVLYETGDYDGALAEFEALDSDHQAAAVYADLCRGRLSQDVELASYDECADECCAPTDCGDAVDCGSACCAPRTWHLTFITGYQYDSNVTLEPQFQGLGAGRGIEDSSWFEALFGDYQLVQRDNWNFGLIGSAYANQYFQASEFDAQDYMGGAYANALLDESILLGMRYEFHDSLLDYSQFATEHRLVPNLSIIEGDFGHSTFFYEFDGRQFDVPPLIPALDRSGNVNAVGATQAIYTWEGLGRIYFGYRHEWVDADGSDFDRRTNMVTARVERPIGERFVADVDVQQYWDDYENPNSLDFFENPREDDRTEVRAGLQFIWTEHISLRADYTFINSNSNTQNLFDVRFYDYNRHLLSTQFIYDF